MRRRPSSTTVAPPSSVHFWKERAGNTEPGLRIATSFDDGSTVTVRSGGEYDVTRAPTAPLPEYDITVGNPRFDPSANPLHVATSHSLTRLRSTSTRSPLPEASARAASEDPPWDVATPAPPPPPRAAQSVEATQSEPRSATVATDAPLGRSTARTGFTENQLRGLIRDEELLADLQAIVRTGAPVPRASAETPAREPAPSIAQSREEQNRAAGAADPTPSNEHAIFETIARNMRYATAYNLGSVELRRRFEAFDREDAMSRDDVTSEPLAPAAAGSRFDAFDSDSPTRG